MLNIVRGLRLAALVSVAAALSACAPASYLVKKPAASNIAGTAATTTPAAWVIEDQRRGAERDFSTGVLTAGLRTEAGPLQPVPFLAEHLQAELASRGLPVQVREAGAGATPSLFLQTFRMQNHRSNGFAPFITFTYLSADIDTPAGKKRVAAFVKRGKVPVWSFDEVIEPTLNQPLSLAVKELATKIAAQAYGWRASDAQLNTLLAKLAAPAKLDGDAHLDVYALGFTNHPGAKERLLQLAQHSDEYVRLAAISSLGTLGAKDQYGWLKSLYERRDTLWQDRAMALKSIGDLGTPEARALLTEELKRWEAAKTDKESLWTAQVIRLYL
jgi:hypothetical protein